MRHPSSFLVLVLASGLGLASAGWAGDPANAPGRTFAPPTVFPQPSVEALPTMRSAAGELVARAKVTLPPGAYMRPPGEELSPLVVQPAPGPGIEWGTIELEPVRSRPPRGNAVFDALVGEFEVRVRSRAPAPPVATWSPGLALRGAIELAGGVCIPLSREVLAPAGDSSAPSPGSAREGRLRVEAGQPDARTRILPGERMMIGAAAVTELPAGSYHLVIDAPHRHPERRQVTVEPGRETVVTTSLAPARPAHLLLSVFPEGARVEEGGKLLGISGPHLVLTLEPGFHVLELRLPGHREVFPSFELRSGERRRALHRLIPESR